ncbi:hypothetical protein HanRHA438_Chr08g0331141 [Helianthus annuus]|nr:hypothetical protein HanRHA438_Chr08g0331141 [Helianthus annuus]
MMLIRPDRKARPVVREKSADAPLWRMFEPDFQGKVELIACGEREGFNLEIVGNFRVPTREILNAPVPEGEGTLGDLGKFEKTVPKKHVERKQVKKSARGRGKEKLRVLSPLLWCRRWWCGCRWDCCRFHPCG